MISSGNPVPEFMRTPASAIPQIGRESVRIDGQTIWLERPTDSDRLLDDPAVLRANVADDYMPYWADIWPAARMLAKVIGREPWEGLCLAGSGPTVALELGCGLGLAGIAALKRGLRVIFSDYDLTALEFAARNARLNGCTEFETMPLDWRYPPNDLKVPLIIAADLTYELKLLDPLIGLIKRVLLPDGLCLLADPDRSHAAQLRQRLSDEGMVYETQFVRAGEPGGFRTKGTLYRIRHRK